MSEELKKIVFSRDSIEFVTVAVQYCAYIENVESENREELVDKLTKLLPLLYIKASLMPETDLMNDEDQEIAVQEEDYNYIASKLYVAFGEEDTYLEVFLQDMKYSDTPISASIAEDLTDIYQDTKNCIAIYERGIEENMNDALYLCAENFKTYWGQKLVNVLRALHMLKYTNEEGVVEDELDEIPTDDLW